jgi:hypothetical protein
MDRPAFYMVQLGMIMLNLDSVKNYLIQVMLYSKMVMIHYLYLQKECKEDVLLFLTLLVLLLVKLIRQNVLSLFPDEY